MSDALDFDLFRCITFDCYGTLIDWETGLLNALRPIVAAHGVKAADQELLKLYGELEAAEQRRPYRRYREVLKAVVFGLGERLSFRASLEQAESLPESIAQWQPFPDTVEALRRLSAKYKLAIISNIDDDLFAHSAKLLQVSFEAVTTAQQAQAYKPSHKIFELAFQKLGLPREHILHAGQSLYHDVAPARELGLHSVWVNRASRRPGAGATISAAVKPDLEVNSLKALADRALG
ncbi:MAG TPA: haloacid dehalogenase type II [Terriglobales bacterium]|nr:haloacid dehalogenase type II [Terriglobales bacterium]